MKIKKVETAFLIMGYFIGFEKYAVDVFYNRKHQKWLVDHSNDTESLNTDNNNFHAEYDEKGFITNAKFTPYHNSIPLTENDFIDIQIKLLNSFLDLKDLKNMELIQIQYFKNYLQDRIKTIERETEFRNMETNKFISEMAKQQDEIKKYIQSYKHNFFSNLVDIRNKDEKENLLFYGKNTAQLLDYTDQQLKLIENLQDRYDLLSRYNKYLYYLITHTIQLYKTINEYRNTDDAGYRTIIFLKKEKIFNSLKSLKSFSEKIKDEIIDSNTEKAITIKNYFILKFDVWIGFLDNTIGIDIYKSPLKTDFEEVKFVLENSINLNELKITNKLKSVTSGFLDLCSLMEGGKEVKFENNFDKVKETEVFEYFKTNLVGKNYLSEKVLSTFLSLAFDKKALPKQKFSFEKLNTQSDIVQIFYNYYKITAGKPYGKQKEYLNLLCNYFNGFENFNIKNFSK